MALDKNSIKDELIRRRALLIAPLAFGGLLAVSSRGGGRRNSAANPNEELTIIDFDDRGKRVGPQRVKPVIKPDSEWRRQLTAEQYWVARRRSTDTPYTGTYYQSHESGLFRCICCGTAVFSSQVKFDSGTGWPSFWEPIAAENVRNNRDVSLLLERTEVACARCDAHLGHVFQDGPEPTGLRYCINESSLRFVRA